MSVLSSQKRDIVIMSGSPRRLHECMILKIGLQDERDLVFQEEKCGISEVNKFCVF